MKLPLDCSVDYWDDFLTPKESEEIYHTLINQYNINQSKLTVEAGGKIIETDSYKILFATQNLIKQNTHPEHIHGKVYPWTGIMNQLKVKIETLLDREFELAMCIYYPDGNYFAPLHRDQETSGSDTILPSISLGEVREFIFKKDDNNDIYSLNLANGSLLVMGAHCQSRYTHSLIKNPAYKNGRINITFRDREFR